MSDLLALRLVVVGFLAAVVVSASVVETFVVVSSALFILVVSGSVDIVVDEEVASGFETISVRISVACRPRLFFAGSCSVWVTVVVVVVTAAVVVVSSIMGCSSSDDFRLPLDVDLGAMVAFFLSISGVFVDDSVTGDASGAIVVSCAFVSWTKN
jgi:hypothetical protein